MFHVDSTQRESVCLHRYTKIREYLLLGGWNSEEFDNFKVNKVSQQLITYEK